MKRIVILGIGGNCIDILDTINAINKVHSTYDCIGFLDDNPENLGKSIYGIEVIGKLSDADQIRNAYFVNGIGSPLNFYKKKAIISKAAVPIERFETIVHPTASVSELSVVGLGCVIFQNVTISSNVKLGNHVIILPNSVISHDVVIGDYTCVTGGVCISGAVTIGESCYLGTNSSIIGNITIGNYSLIGMGSTVIESTQPNSVVVGNPARFIRSTF